MKSYAEYRQSGLSWLGDVPSHWSMDRIKYLFDRVQRPYAEDAETVTAFRDGIVTRRSNRRTDGFTEADQYIGYQGIEIGDLAIHAMDGFAGAIGVADSSGKCSPVVSVCEAKSDSEAEYYAQILRHVARSGYLTAIAKGIRERSTDFRWSDARDLFVPIPPTSEQRAVVDYLDRETARIDDLVEEQRRLISMLRERRQAVIDLAFDGIPKNSRIARACVDIVDCPHTTPTVDTEGHFEAVRTASVRAGRFRPGYGLRVSEATWRERNANGSPSPGDVLFAREGGSAGEAAMVPSADICLAQRMVLLRIDHKVCDGEFLLWQIYSNQIQDRFRLATSGAAAGNIRLPVLRRTAIWLPSVETQREVAAALNEKITRIDTLTNETERFIELARERRSALISAAVTGQIDVREIA